MAALDTLQRLPVSPFLLKLVLLASTPFLLSATVYFYLVPNVFKVYFIRDALAFYRLTFS